MYVLDSTISFRHQEATRMRLERSQRKRERRHDLRTYRRHKRRQRWLARNENVLLGGMLLFCSAALLTLMVTIAVHCGNFYLSACTSL